MFIELFNDLFHFFCQERNNCLFNLFRYSPEIIGPNTDDYATFQSQSFLDFQELFLETSTSTERDYLVVLNQALTSAMTSISTNAPFGNVLTATAERAGYGSVKNSA